MALMETLLIPNTPALLAKILETSEFSLKHSKTVLEKMS